LNLLLTSKLLKFFGRILGEQERKEGMNYKC
jgi:hypothetical protein